MDRDTRNSAVAAAVMLLAFGVGAYFLPGIVIAAGSFSPWVGGAVAVAFVGAFFLVFWLRGRARRGDDRR
jgi:membrane protein implicated in regulation of membrane protease activity